MKGENRRKLTQQDIQNMITEMVAYIKKKIAPVLTKKLKDLGADVTHMALTIPQEGVKVSDIKKENQHSKAPIYELLLPLEFEITFNTEGETLTRSFLWELSCLMTPLPKDAWGVVMILYTIPQLKDAPIQNLYSYQYTFTISELRAATPEERKPIRPIHLPADNSVAERLALLFAIAFLPRTQILVEILKKGATHIITAIEARPHFIFPNDSPEAEKGKIEYLFSITSPTPRLYLANNYINHRGVGITLEATIDARLRLTFIPYKVGSKALQRNIPCELSFILTIVDTRWKEGERVDLDTRLVIKFPQISLNVTPIIERADGVPLTNLKAELWRIIQKITPDEITSIMRGLHEVFQHPTTLNLLFQKGGENERNQDKR